MLTSSRIVKITWIFCPGNDRADKLANSAPIGAKTIQWDGEEVLNQLINESRKQLEYNQDYHLERLRDRDIQLGSGQTSMLRGRTRSIYNQKLVGQSAFSLCDVL